MVQSPLDSGTVSWDGVSLMAETDDGLRLEQPASEAGVPMPATDMPLGPVQVLLWPVERLVVRPFSLPLRHRRLLDEDILGQELQEQMGGAAPDVWLSWHAAEREGNVEGLVFGLESRAQIILAEHPAWANCPSILPDAWVRLTHHLIPEEHDHPARLAILDEDREGLFIGVRDNGIWRGMRRINRQPWKDDAMIDEEMLRSLQAMGFDSATQEMRGRVSTTLASRLATFSLHWHGEVCDEELPERQRANLAAATPVSDTEVNFRRGSWKADAGWQQGIRPWRHTIVLAAVLLILLIGIGGYRIHTLDAQVEASRHAITTAFHRGLPNEPVMLDALAQLRAAAHGGEEGSRGRFLRHLEAVAQVHRDINGWQIRHIEYDNHTMHLAGTASDFDMINRIREALTKRGYTAQIEDTETEEQQVRFRLKWS